jgi:hypothetical protein
MSAAHDAYSQVGAIELPVAVVQAEGDLDRREDRDSDDDEVEPVPPAKRSTRP